MLDILVCYRAEMEVLKDGSKSGTISAGTQNTSNLAVRVFHSYSALNS